MSVEPRRDPDGGDHQVIVRVSDGWHVARDVESGVTSQGKTKPEALGNLADALKLHAESTPESDEEEPADAPWF